MSKYKTITHLKFIINWHLQFIFQQPFFCSLHNSKIMKNQMFPSKTSFNRVCFYFRQPQFAGVTGYPGLGLGHGVIGPAKMDNLQGNI